MSKHTPGPWKMNWETGELESEDFVIGQIYGADSFPCLPTDEFYVVSEELHANGVLAAMAPDLLGACRMVVAGMAPSTVEEAEIFRVCVRLVHEVDGVVG